MPARRTNDKVPAVGKGAAAAAVGLLLQASQQQRGQRIGNGAAQPFRRRGRPGVLQTSTMLRPSNTRWPVSR